MTKSFYTTAKLITKRKHTQLKKYSGIVAEIVK